MGHTKKKCFKCQPLFYLATLNFSKIVPPGQKLNFVHLFVELEVSQIVSGVEY